MSVERNRLRYVRIGALLMNTVSSRCFQANTLGSRYTTQRGRPAVGNRPDNGVLTTMAPDIGSSRRGSVRPRNADTNAIRRWAYPFALIAVLGVWTVYMATTNSWWLFGEYWPITLTMSLGSFVAGATAEGGAAIAFPVFTKILGIDAETARTFGLLIQSVGMSMAGVVIIARRVPILPRVIAWVSVGGFAGQVIGTFWISIGPPYSKILFTFVAAVFGVALVLSRWILKLPVIDALPSWRANDRAFYAMIGVAGGVFAANTGSGIDMLTFVVLTLAIGINEKVSTPSTVIIMAINSVIGASLHAFVLHDVGIAFDYWLVAVPIVVFGAPLGAYVASKAKRDHIIVLLVSLISIELISTLVLVPFSTEAKIVAVAAIAASVVWFSSMLRYRATHVVPLVDSHRVPENAAIESPGSVSPSSEAGRTRAAQPVDKGPDK